MTCGGHQFLCYKPHGVISIRDCCLCCLFNSCCTVILEGGGIVVFSQLDARCAFKCLSSITSPQLLLQLTKRELIRFSITGEGVLRSSTRTTLPLHGHFEYTACRGNGGTELVLLVDWKYVCISDRLSHPSRGKEEN